MDGDFVPVPEHLRTLFNRPAVVNCPVHGVTENHLTFEQIGREQRRYCVTCLLDVVESLGCKHLELEPQN